MADFIFSLNATLPIFLIMVLGWFLMRIGLFNKEFNKVADKYVFKVALPVLLFKDIATADIRSDFNLTFVLFCMITTTIMFLAIWGLSYIFIKDKTQVGAFAQASARGSAAVLGIAKLIFQKTLCNFTILQVRCLTAVLEHHGTAADVSYIKICSISDGILVFLTDLLNKVVNRLRLYNAYRTSAEACTCHT